MEPGCRVGSVWGSAVPAHAVFPHFLSFMQKRPHLPAPSVKNFRG